MEKKNGRKTDTVQFHLSEILLDVVFIEEMRTAKPFPYRVWFSRSNVFHFCIHVFLNW